MKLVSYTLTREQIWADVKDVYLSAVKDLAEDFINGDDRRGIAELFNIKSDFKAHVQLWCDMYSEQFFKNNPDVSDILVALETTKDGIVIKEWIASR